MVEHRRLLNGQHCCGIGCGRRFLRFKRQSLESVVDEKHKGWVAFDVYLRTYEEAKGARQWNDVWAEREEKEPLAQLKSVHRVIYGTRKRAA